MEMESFRPWSTVCKPNLKREFLPENHQKTGIGSFITDGFVYSGEWKDNKFNGFGYYFEDEYIYVGNFKDDEKNLQGYYKDIHGCSYLGEWVNDFK